MFQKQYPTDSYIYVEIARRIDFIYRKYVGQSPQAYLRAYKKQHPECRLPEKLIYFLVTRRWNMVKAYPRFQTFNEICKLVGFELWDLFMFIDPDEVPKHKKILPPKWKIKTRGPAFDKDQKFGI
jgi:hypothetical protein